MTSSAGRTGVWLIGALGGLATTAMVGARLFAQGYVGATGLLTESPECAGLGLVPIQDLVFGGHDVRRGTLADSARDIAQDNGSLDPQLIARIAPDLAAIDAEIRLGEARRSGPTIEALADRAAIRDRSGRATKDAIAADLMSFRARHGLARLVVVNVASTEPAGLDPTLLATPKDLELALDRDDPAALRPSLLYALAALEAGAAYLNFTPNRLPTAPGVVRWAESKGLPIMGNDGKSGETLIKSALAPMFRDRELRVLSWQGYNILGDRDGQVLADPSNKSAKLQSKDSVLGSILGYPLHTHVGIDYVPSLGDMKTAWDFIHFQGFLGTKMSMQFIWQGCDAILAAPLVLDMVRFLDHALQTGHAGLCPWLGAYFKSPLGVAEQDFHRQMDALRAHLHRARTTPPPGA